MKTKKITTIGILSAISIVFILLIRIPFPLATFLVFDAGDVPLLLISFLFGPLYALIATIIVATIQGLSFNQDSGIVGIVMHIIASGTLVTVSGYFYRKFHTIKGAILSLLFGSIAMVLIMIPANLYISVKFWHMPYDVVVAMLPTAIIPFNIIKAFASSIIVFFVYKPLRRYLFKN